MKELSHVTEGISLADAASWMFFIVLIAGYAYFKVRLDRKEASKTEEQKLADEEEWWRRQW